MSPHSFDRRSPSIVFALITEHSTDSLRKLILFFYDHGITLNHFHMNRLKDGTASVVLHCVIEKKDIETIKAQLAALVTILSVQRLDGK
jgi:hypothetical protein